MRRLICALIVGLAAAGAGCGDSRKSEIIVDKDSKPLEGGPKAIKGGIKSGGGGNNAAPAPPPPPPAP